MIENLRLYVGLAYVYSFENTSFAMISGLASFVLLHAVVYAPLWRRLCMQGRCQSEHMNRLVQEDGCKRTERAIVLQVKLSIFVKFEKLFQF